MLVLPDPPRAVTDLGGPKWLATQRRNGHGSHIAVRVPGAPGATARFHWINWDNNQLLHSALDHQTTKEYEKTYYARQIGKLPDDAANKTAA